MPVNFGGYLQKELQTHLLKLPGYLSHPQRWQSLLINKHPPVIHRLSLKVATDRTLILHKVFPCHRQSAYMHSHSWPFALKIISGGYEMGLGFSDNRNQVPPAVYTTLVKPGDIYEMSSSQIWHYTKPITDQPSYSVMLIGERWRERQAQNHSPLSHDDKTHLLTYFKTKFPPIQN